MVGRLGLAVEDNEITGALVTSPGVVAASTGGGVSVVAGGVVTLSRLDKASGLRRRGSSPSGAACDT